MNIEHAELSEFEKLRLKNIQKMQSMMSGILATPPKPRSCEKFLWKKQEKKRNPQESYQEQFFGTKK